MSQPHPHPSEPIDEQPRATLTPDATPAGHCSDLHEIRAEIDRLDRSIIALLADRLTYVHAAAAFKTSTASVRALDRVESMLVDRERWAEQLGLEPRMIRQMYQLVVQHFTNIELEKWNNNDNGRVGIEERRRLGDEPVEPDIS